MSTEPGAMQVGRSVRPTMVRVWDPLVRLFHWSLVGLFAFAFLSGDDWKSAHILAGYIVGGLLVFRLLWGVVGSKNARFANFVRGPSAVLAYLGKTLSFRAPPRYIGHNPAGGAMIVALLATIAIIVTTGYMMTTDAFWGVEWVEKVHETTVYLTLGLIALHIGGVVLASIEHRENLIRSMFTGMKRLD